MISSTLAFPKDVRASQYRVSRRLSKPVRRQVLRENLRTASITASRSQNHVAAKRRALM